MPQETIQGKPAQLTGGDSLVWRESAPDDSSELDSATYVFTNPDTQETFRVSGAVDPSDSNSYLFTIKGGDTADLQPGRFVAALVLEYEWGRETERDAAFIELLPNPEREPEPTHVERTVALLEKHIEGRLPEGLDNFTVGGVPIQKISLIDAEALLTRYRARLRDEQAARRVANGQESGRRVLGTFR